MMHMYSPVGFGKDVEHRGRKSIENDRMTSSAPMESADHTAQAGGRVSTTIVVLA